MTSRLAYTFLSTLIAFALAGDVAIGASALSPREDANASQYGPTPPPNEKLAAGQSSSGGAVQAAPVQAARQVQVQTLGQLPFTGFAALPVLLLGVALLVVGIVVRRGSQRPSRN